MSKVCNRGKWSFAYYVRSGDYSYYRPPLNTINMDGTTGIMVNYVVMENFKFRTTHVKSTNSQLLRNFADWVARQRIIFEHQLLSIHMSNKELEMNLKELRYAR